MKKLCWPFVAVICAILMSSCSAGVQAVIPTYTDPTQTITVKNGEQFVLQLTYDPSAGYTWYEDYDPNKLQLLESTCVFCRVGENDFIGRQGFGFGGQAPMAAQFARFRTLATGETRVTLALKTSPSSPAAQQLTFNVVVQP